MKQRVLHIAVALLAIALLFTACGGQKETQKKTQPDVTVEKVKIPVDENYFLLCCENSNNVIDFENSRVQSVQYELISAFPITENTKISLAFDKDVPFTLEAGYEDCEVETLDNIAAQTYAGVNWTQLADRLQACKTAEEADRVKDEIYSDPKLSLEGDESTKLYSTLLLITFNEPVEAELTQLTISIGDKEQTYDIGSIKLTNGVEPEKSCAHGDGFLLDPVAWVDAPMELSEQGLYVTYDYEVQIESDVTLKSIKASVNSVHLTKVSVIRTEKDGTEVMQLWDMSSPLQLKKGETVSFDIEAVDDANKDQMIASSQYAVVFLYEQDGKTFYTDCEINSRARYNAFCTYLAHETKYDVRSYETAFQSALEACEKLK